MRVRLALIADDSPVIRMLVARQIREHGIEVREVESVAGASGLEARRFACALLDLDLGDGYGTEIARVLRATEPHFPVAFFTSEREGEALVLAASLGPVFKKPDDLSAAVAWVVEWTTGGRARDL